MTDGQQIALSIAPTVLPTLTVLIGILVNNKRIEDLKDVMKANFGRVDQRFDSIEKLFEEKLRRVEDVMDARLKHLEERA